MAVSALGIESHSIDYVPLAERHGKVWHLWPVWFTGDAHLATLAVGVLGITLGTNLFWTAVAIVLGCALGTFFMAFHSTQGPQLGLPQMIQSRPQFGYLGALLVCREAGACVVDAAGRDLVQPDVETRRQLVAAGTEDLLAQLQAGAAR